MGFSLQFKTVLKKNLLISWRNKDILKENGFPFFAGILLFLVKYLTPLQFMAPLVIPLAISGSSRSTLLQMVEEKAERYKETQKIMGLRQGSYISGWITSSYVKGIGSVVTFLFVPVVAGLAFIDSPGMLILGYPIYYFAAIHQALCLSTLFSQTKMASEIGTLLTIIPIFLVFLIFVEEIRTTQAFYWLLGLFPQCAIGLSYLASLNSDASFYQTPPVSDYFTPSDAVILLIIDAVLYMVLYFYFDQIIPNEYGVAKHPLFFIQGLFKKKSTSRSRSRMASQNNQSSLQQSLNDGGEDEEEGVHRSSSAIIDTSSADFHEPYPNEKKLPSSVIIKNLTKHFGDFTAVNNISLTLYESNIFCLLGHNGAGKTTTISLLTGMIGKDGGKVSMYDNDLEEDIEEIRQNIGLCTQRDCLYDDLTFSEHLHYIGSIKGLQGSELEDQINYILDKTSTHEEANKLAKELSGGQKRKLSLGMALIGGSQVVFLDEPTSGMDNLSRRAIWDILESVREEKRTLVLTTHHLDEAEVLADRIAIMAKGKLLAVGSSQFIKKNFGEGYTLRISVEAEHLEEFQNTIKPQLKSIIESSISDSQFNPQTPADTILYLIPFSQQKNFLKLFKQLEQFPQINIDLVMNSLEDAFVNIGMDEEKFLEKNKRRMSGVGKKPDVKNEFSNFSDITVPDCLKNPPTYSFVNQLTAIFLRRFYYTIRNFTNWISFVIGLFLLIAATMIVDLISVPDDMKSAKNYFKITFMSNFIVLAFTFNSSIYISLPVLERETNLKYALNVMGCRIAPYWIGTFLFDYLIFFLTIVIFELFCIIQWLDYIMDEFWQIFFILLSFGTAYITSSYFWGFFFKKASAALKYFPLMSFLLIYSLPWMLCGPIFSIYNSDYIGTDTYEILNGLAQIPSYLLSPLFALQFSFMSLFPQNPGQKNMGQTLTGFVQFCLLMIGSALMFMGITLLIEQKKFGLKNQGDNTDQSQIMESIPEAGDQYVKEELQRVENDGGEAIRVQGLIKKYDSGCLAVQNTNFCIDKGEIFGLLGPNGAGKSTTFGILTSLIPKTYGSLKIKGIEVDKGIMEIYQDVGICPQFDCLWENLSPPEHLRLFGRMKGLKGKDLDLSEEYFIKTMQLSDMVKKKAGQLSGGNKRKLCVANALIGGPDIQFFDEPSTGVDPIARRFLWNTLTIGLKLRNSAIVMTTHTMDEAESLCSKIGILIKGQFYTIGSPQQLRNMYGSGYNITFKLNKRATKKEILERLKRVFQDVSEINDKRTDYVTFQIAREGFSFIKTFSLCEEDLKANKLIDDFSINQSSLEQVYQHFSKFQTDEEEHNLQIVQTA